MFKKSILKLGIPSLLLALTIATLSVVAGGGSAKADVPGSYDSNARGSWVNAYYVDYDGQRFVDSNPNDGNHTYIYTSPGSNPCTSDIKFDGDPIWQNGDAQNAKVTVRSPAASGGCEQKSTEAPAGFDNTGNRDVFFFSDQDGNIKHVSKSGLIFKKQSGYWYYPGDTDANDAGGNPCRDIITGDTLIAVKPVEKNTVQPSQYERFYQAIGKTPPASGLVCASTLGAIKVAETYSINTNIPPSEITGAGGMLRLHIGPASSATGPNVGKAAPADGSQDTDTTNTPTCEAGALGWVICPIVTAMSTVNDAIFKLIESRLYINPVTVSTDQPLYQVWSAFRNIANIAFVIAFLVVIFSQATSIGLSSYGIKKMLPRIIVTAILVNLSFFVCQVALDFSNIIGGSIGDIVNNIINQQGGWRGNIDALNWSGLITGIIAGGAVAGVLGTALAAGGVGAIISLLLPFLITALFAALTALVIIIAREAIIILLIAIAPIAFVAYILPNTEKYFERWRSVAVTMLLLYPFVALLFAGCKLAAAIILNTARTEDNIDATDPFIALTALIVMFVPLLGVPLIVRFSGGLLGRIAGAVNNPNAGPFDALKKRAQGYSEYKQNQAKARNLANPKSKNPFAIAARSKRNREYQYGLAKGFASETEQEYTARSLMGEENKNRAKRYARAAGGSPEAATAIQASAKAAVDKLDRESMQNRETLIRARYDPREMIGKLGTTNEKRDRAGNIIVERKEGDLAKAVRSGNIAEARAMQNILLNSGSIGIKTLANAYEDLEKLPEGSRVDMGSRSEIGSVLRKDLNSAGLKPKDNALATWSYDRQGRTLEQIANDGDTYKNLTDAEFVGQSPERIKAAVKALDSEGKPAITVERAQQMLDSPNLRLSFSEDKRAAVKDHFKITETQNITNTTNSNNPSQPPSNPGPSGGNTPPTTGPVAPNPNPTPPGSGSGGAAATPSPTNQNFNQSNTTTNYNTTQNVSGDTPRPTTGGFQGDMQIPRSPSSPSAPPSNNPPQPPEDNGGEYPFPRDDNPRT